MLAIEKSASCIFCVLSEYRQRAYIFRDFIAKSLDEGCMCLFGVDSVLLYIVMFIVLSAHDVADNDLPKHRPSWLHPPARRGFQHRGHAALW